MRFPVRLKFRHCRAVIYGRTPSHPYYRTSWMAGGRRVVRSFSTFGEAREAADKALRQAAQGNAAAGMSQRQARDAMAAEAALDELARETGQVRPSLVEVVTEWASATRKLGGRNLLAAVEGFLTTMATVRRVDLGQAVEEYLATKATPAGGRGTGRGLNPVYVSHLRIWLHQFAATFPNLSAAELTRQHLDLWATGLAKLGGPKSRNDRRTCVRSFVRWCERRDYVGTTARLLDAEALRAETWTPEAIECYSPNELARLLENASPDLVAPIALQAFAGLRQQEVARLTWASVFRVAGHIEVSVAASKTRSRRLVDMHPTLAAWLQPYRNRPMTERVWPGTATSLALAFKALRARCRIRLARNGLRHGWTSCFFAITSDENRTAAQAGNSPQMIHAHYKGLVPRQEAETWFSILPPTPNHGLPVASNVGGAQ